MAAHVTRGGLLALACIIAKTVIGQGLEPVVCNSIAKCGYGSKCDRTTERCVCQSDNETLRQRNGNPFSLFYCVGKGVTECGDQLCGYKAECKQDKCECSSRNDVLTYLKGTSPSLWFCLESCSPGDSSCPENTMCVETSDVNNYRCHSSGDSTRSSTGQCLAPSVKITTGTPNNRVTGENGKQKQDDNDTAPSVKSTTGTPNNRVTGENGAQKQDDNDTDDDDFQTLVIGLAAGIGGAVLLVLVLVAVLVAARRRKRNRGDNSSIASLRRLSVPPDPANRHVYSSIVDPPRTPGPSGTDNLAGPTVVSVNNSPPRPRAYEEVNDDFAIPHSIAKVTKEKDKTEERNFNGLYSNPTIPFNKAQQRKTYNLSEAETLPNNYNTLYYLTPTNTSEGSLQPDMTGSGQTGGSKESGEYETAYSAVGARGGNNVASYAASKGEYDELKLPRV